MHGLTFFTTLASTAGRVFPHFRGGNYVLFSHSVIGLRIIILRVCLTLQDLEEEPSMRGTSEKGWSETLSPVSKDVSPVQDLSEETVPPPPPVVTTPVGRSHTKRYVIKSIESLNLE